MKDPREPQGNWERQGQSSRWNPKALIVWPVALLLCGLGMLTVVTQGQVRKI